MDVQSENEPLIGSLRALSVDEETLQLQPQPAGPRQHDAPPSDAAVHQMGVVAAVAALRTHVAVARVAEEACARVAALCHNERFTGPTPNRQLAVEKGALEAVVAAMLAHRQVASVQEWGLPAVLTRIRTLHQPLCAVRTRATLTSLLRRRAACPGWGTTVYARNIRICQPRARRTYRVLRGTSGCQAARNICCGEDPAGLARKQRAVEGRVLVAVTAAMRAHRQAVGLQESGCATLRNLGCGEFPEAPARSQLAAEAGALEAVVGAMLTHLQVAAVQEQGCGALRSMCCSTDAAARARGQHAAEVWALEVVTAALHAHPQVAAVQVEGCGALFNICYGTDTAAPSRRQRAVQAGGPRAAAAALLAHPGDAEVQQRGQMVIDRIVGK